MARRNQPDRWESLILAGALAVAGTWFLFEKCAFLVRNLDLARAILHASPALLVGVAVSLILASAGTEPGSTRHSGEGRHE
jgi:hypothetical protein